MKFFKHFTDAHRGQSLQSVRNRLGMEGIGRYWILVEICAEKMSKSADEEYTEIHCTFTFDRRYLRDTLATHQLSGVEKFLRCLTDVGLMSYTCVDDVVEIYMPKLLESLDRDTKRARTERAVSAPKRKRKIESKREEEEKEAKLVSSVVDLVNFIGDEGLGDLFKIYPQDLIDFELQQMVMWLKQSPQKNAKKNYLVFANNWLKKSLKDRKESQRSQNVAQRSFGIIGA